jgi:hypothetical protein
MWVTGNLAMVQQQRRKRGSRECSVRTTKLPEFKIAWDRDRANSAVTALELSLIR